MARHWNLFDETGGAFGHLIIAIDAGKFQGQRIQHAVRAGAEDNRVPGCNAVKFFACGVSLFFESCDKNLSDINDAAFRLNFGPVGNIGEQLADILNIRDFMVVFVSGGTDRMGMAVHKAWHECPALKVNDLDIP